MFSFSLVWRLLVAAVLLLISLASFAEDGGVGAALAPVAAAPSAAPATAPSAAATPASATAADQPVAVTPPNAAGGQAAPGAVELAPAAVGKAAEKQAAVTDPKSGGDAETAVTPSLPGTQVDPLDCGSTSNGMSAKSGFGYDVLGGKSSVITDGPIDDTYLITPGDEIVVSIWGELSEMLNLVVSREGYIDLPQGGGRIPTNGMTLGELRPQIMRALAQIYAAFINVVEPSKSTAFVDIRLGKLNELTIFVLGEVKNPGNYRITPGAANVINLINNAGGVRNSGSLRTVQIHRSSGVVDTVDLYRFFLSGDLDLKLIRVRQGDHIVVPLERKSVCIEGEVLRPHHYELVGEEGLRELVELAGGFKPDAYAKQVQLRRFELNKGEVLVDVDLDEVMRDPARNVPLMNGDTISVTKNVQVRKNSVSIKGDGITRAGTYEWTPGMTLGDLINKANGLREYAYLDRADLIRTEDDFSKNLMVIRLADFYKRDERGKFSPTAESRKNLLLQPMDEVIIQSIFGMAGKDPHVTMEGHVKEPGRFVLARNMKLYDLVFSRGGFQDESFRRATYLDTAHVFRKVSGTLGKKIISFNLDALLNNDPSANLPIQDGDVIRIYSADEMRIEQTVSIDGLVKNPGSYPIAEGMTLEDLLVIAGGLVPDAFRVEATIARSDGDANPGGAIVGEASTTMRIPVDINNYMNLARDQRTPLKPDDRVTLRATEGGERAYSAQVDGEVVDPGHYSLIQKNELLSSLIRRAGGLKETALPEGATVLRRKTGLRSLDGAKPQEDYRVPVNIRAALNEPGGPDDIVVLHDDRIYVPANPGVVEVRGAVRRELSLKHKTGRSLADYIELCGGYLGKADPANVLVFSPNQTALTLKRTTKSKSGRTASVQDIPPGSIIEVPFIRATERLQTVEVNGAVNKPVLIQHIEGAPLGYYLNLSGGFSPDADLDNISVLLPDGGLLVKTGNQSFNPVLPGGSKITVTSKTTRP